MTGQEIRQKYLDFFKARGHAEIKPSRIVLDNDPSTLFTSSGMQPLIPYLLGEIHPSGVRLVNSQPSFRSGDIEEVGDNRHTTFFEMLGNWSLGDYFKKEQLEWLYQFLVEELKLDPKRFHVTVFEGNDLIPKDEETFNIWKDLKLPEERIYFYGIDKNWWSKSGTPDQMPVGEIGGTDSEVFYEFPQVEHDPKYGESCHPHCDCGHFLEIGNSVFIEYKRSLPFADAKGKKTGDREFEKLPQKNVDFGGGLERLTAATNDNPDIFQIDLLFSIIRIIEQKTGKSYGEPESAPLMRVIADHLRAATFLILDGVVPSNKLQGYVLRRLLRRSAVKMRTLSGKLNPSDSASMIQIILTEYNGLFDINAEKELDRVVDVVIEEMARFQKTLEKGLKEIEKIGKNGNVTGKMLFDLYQTWGFPYELSKEELEARGIIVPPYREFVLEWNLHKQASRTASAGMFKGGLAGHSEVEIIYHTATHLLHQALRDVLGPEVFQKGSNINEERLRFDFSYDKKMTDEEIEKIENLVNQKIEEDLKVDRKFMSVSEAKKLNAIGLFDEKYGQEVSIYCIGPGYTLDSESRDQRDRGGYYSVEFCGGPHVEHTGTIGGIKITKEEGVSSGIRRIRAEIMIR